MNKTPETNSGADKEGQWEGYRVTLDLTHVDPRSVISNTAASRAAALMAKQERTKELTQQEILGQLHARGCKNMSFEQYCSEVRQRSDYVEGQLMQQFTVNQFLDAKRIARRLRTMQTADRS